jgi:hypothetical protein
MEDRTTWLFHTRTDQPRTAAGVALTRLQEVQMRSGETIGELAMAKGKTRTFGDDCRTATTVKTAEPRWDGTNLTRWATLDGWSACEVAASPNEGTGRGDLSGCVEVGAGTKPKNVATSQVEKGAENGSRIKTTSQMAHAET